MGNNMGRYTYVSLRLFRLKVLLLDSAGVPVMLRKLSTSGKFMFRLMTLAMLQELDPLPHQTGHMHK